MAFGRPTKYDPKYCEELIEFMSQGFSYEAFAGHLTVAISTLYEWEGANPDFSEAKKLAFAKNRIFWEAKGVEGLKNESGPGAVNLNSTVWIFNMKNRFGWRDRTEHSGEVKGGITAQDIADLMKKKNGSEPEQE